MELLFRGTFGESEMAAAAKMILQQCGEEKLFLLKGNLGSGKTTLCREILKEMGYEGKVSSPTFGIVNDYLLPDQSEVHHLDLYRIKNEEEILEAGIFEILGSGEICLIEWPEIIESTLRGSFIIIEISPQNDRRKIEVFRQEAKD